MSCGATPWGPSPLLPFAGLCRDGDQEAGVPSHWGFAPHTVAGPQGTCLAAPSRHHRHTPRVSHGRETKQNQVKLKFWEKQDSSLMGCQ